MLSKLTWDKDAGISPQGSLGVIYKFFSTISLPDNKWLLKLIPQVINGSFTALIINNKTKFYVMHSQFLGRKCDSKIAEKLTWFFQ